MFRSIDSAISTPRTTCIERIVLVNCDLRAKYGTEHGLTAYSNLTISEKQTKNRTDFHTDRKETSLTLLVSPESPYLNRVCFGEVDK